MYCVCKRKALGSEEFPDDWKNTDEAVKDTAKKVFDSLQRKEDKELRQVFKGKG